MLLSFNILALCITSIGNVSARALQSPDGNDTVFGNPKTLVAQTIANLPAKGTSCQATTINEGHDFKTLQIQDAIQAGIDLQQDGKTVGTSQYPHPYGNKDGFNFPNCPAGSDWFIFPILTTGLKYNGGAPLAYRVVYLRNSADGVYCGVIQHTENNDNRFLKPQCVDDKGGRTNTAHIARV